MRRVVTNWSQRRVHISGKTGAVALMLFLLLGLALAASSAQVHELICPNAGQADDFCAIKQLQGGLVEPAPAPAVVATVLFILVAACCRNETLYRASALYRLSPSRAPPSGFSLR